MRRVSIIKGIIVIILLFVATFFFTNKTIFGVYTVPDVPSSGTYTPYTAGGYTEQQIISMYCNPNCPAPGSGLAGSDATGYGGSEYSGFYYSPISGNWYPIGIPAAGGGGGNEDDGTGTCTGVYANCLDWGACSPTCGPGTQTRTCFDTGCGAPQTQSQACMVNDPTVWGTPTTCTVKCGGGTQEHTNQCGTTETIACNTSACPAWTKLKDSSYVSTNSLYNLLSLTPVAYDADDTTDQYFIVGNDGVVAAPGIELDISNLTPTAKTGNPEYKVVTCSGKCDQVK